MQTRLVPSLCSYCGTGCGVLYQVAGERLIATAPNRGYPVNEGCLCIKGWNCHEHAVSDKRLNQPLLRQDEGFAPVTWELALDFAASRLNSILDAHGPEAVGFLASAKATNEENYLAQKFQRSVVGSNNIDHCARL
jgi:predicted molibdopterin-dependent oxidoreductase YjgC